jgi:TPR repeat protein
LNELPRQYALCFEQTTRAKEASDLMRSRFKLITASQIVLLLLLCGAGHGVVLAENTPRGSLSLRKLSDISSGHESKQHILSKEMIWLLSPDSTAEDRRLSTLAANKGDADAQYNLALMNYLGEGGEKSLQEARRLFTPAADQGDADALCALALMNYEDRPNSNWLPLMLAARRGNVDAQYAFGLMNYKGEGREKDLKEARRLFTLAAKRGNVGAQHALALMDYNGE